MAFLVQSEENSLAFGKSWQATNWRAAQVRPLPLSD